MLIKTYKANTNLSINVVLSSKKNLHISFTPLSDGSSIYTTSNEDIMNAIESHYNYGKLFRLHSMQGENLEQTAKVIDINSLSGAEVTPAENEAEVVPTVVNNEGEVTPAKNGAEVVPTVVNNEGEVTPAKNGAEVVPTVVNNEGEVALKKVHISDFASAKDYLADTFGISRTAMRSHKTILELAASHGIEFEGLTL